MIREHMEIYRKINKRSDQLTELIFRNKKHELFGSLLFDNICGIIGVGTAKDSNTGDIFDYITINGIVRDNSYGLYIPRNKSCIRVSFPRFSKNSHQSIYQFLRIECKLDNERIYNLINKHILKML